MTNEGALPGLDAVRKQYGQTEGAADLLDLVAEQAGQISRMEAVVEQAEKQADDFLAGLLDTSPQLWSAAIQAVATQLESGGGGGATARKIALLERMGREIPALLVANRKGELMEVPSTKKKEAKLELKREFQEKFQAEIIKRVGAEITATAETMTHAGLDKVIAQKIIELMQTIGVQAGEVNFFDSRLDLRHVNGSDLNQALHEALAHKQIELLLAQAQQDQGKGPARPELKSPAYRQYIEAELAAFAAQLKSTVGEVATQYDRFMDLLLSQNNQQTARIEPMTSESNLHFSSRFLAQVLQGRVDLNTYEERVEGLDQGRRQMLLQALVVAYGEQPTESSRPLAELLLLVHEDELAGQGELVAKLKAQLEVGGAAELRDKLEAGRLKEAKHRMQGKLERVHFFHNNDGARFDYSLAERVLRGESATLAVDLARQEIATHIILRKVEELIADKPKKYPRDVVNAYTASLDSFKSQRFDTVSQVDAAGELAFLTQFVHFLMTQDARVNSDADGQLQRFFQQAEKLGIDPTHLVDIHNELVLVIGKYNQRFAEISPEQFGAKGRPAIQFRDRLSSLVFNQQFPDKLWQFKVREDGRGVQMQRIGYQQYDGTGLYAWGADIKGSERAASFIERSADEVTTGQKDTSPALALSETGVQLESIEARLKLGERQIDFSRYEQPYGELPNDPFIQQLEKTATTPFATNLEGMEAVGGKLKTASNYGQQVIEEVTKWDQYPEARKGASLFDNPKGRLEERMRQTAEAGGLQKRYKLDNTKEYQYPSAALQEFKTDMEQIRKAKQKKLAEQYAQQVDAIAKRVQNQAQILEALMTHDGVLSQLTEGKLVLPAGREQPGVYAPTEVLQILAGYGESQELKNLYVQFAQSVRKYGEAVTTVTGAKQQPFFEYGVSEEALTITNEARTRLKAALGYENGIGSTIKVQTALLTEKLAPAFAAAKKQQVLSLQPTAVTLKDSARLPGYPAAELQSHLSTKIRQLQERQAAFN